MPPIQSTPFGNPDGSRAEIEDVQKGFVSFGGNDAWGGLATREDDLTARIIVGRKGSGKTVYLRRLRAFASDQVSLYADDIQRSIPSTETVVKFSQWHNTTILTEKWAELWRVAILRSLAAHLLHSPQLKSSVSTDHTEQLRKNFKEILRDFRTPSSVYAQAMETIEQHHTPQQINTYLKHYLWNELEYLIGEIIKQCPPLCFYIDAADEEFAHAPMYWLRCQKGLFYQTMRFLCDSRLGGRLHVFICIRDLVLASVFRGEHATRYRNEPHIRILNWNKEAITYFLRKKVEQLDNEYFLGNLSNGKTIASWLGLDEIQNKVRGIKEPIEQYLLRHTRLLPRDIVMLGNNLCTEIKKSKAIANYKSSEDFIRAAVAKTAKACGNEQLSICANQIIADLMPEHAARQRYAEVYIGNKAYEAGVADDLKRILKLIGKDRCSSSDIEAARSLAKDMWGGSTDPFPVLWQNGLIGYSEVKQKQKIVSFFSEADLDDFILPEDKQSYVFHSCLIDTVGLESVGSEPVLVD